MNKMIADLHCHPNLKTFGHSFAKRAGVANRLFDVWHYSPPTPFTRALNKVSGLSRFRQAGFHSMFKGNVRIAVVSLYPFEKGFFISGRWNGPVSARLANLITGIGYERVRYLQRHLDYFEDLTNEYNFFINSRDSSSIQATNVQWKLAADWNAVQEMIDDTGTISVIPSIEGAHVLNTGLGMYGRHCDEEHVLYNISAIKHWQYPPLFITFAHNFNNDLCGHARSLERLGKAVNQDENLDAGFSPLGIRVLHELLSSSNGKPIYIDIKHMSVRARVRYQEILKHDYYTNNIPVIVSHGAVTGTTFSGDRLPGADTSLFSENDINFFDEELVNIARSRGLFAVQLDANRLAKRQYIIKSWRDVFDPASVKKSAYIIWMQIQHAAEVLDRNSLYSWGTMCIGSDFDGTINPLAGIWTAEDLPALGDALLVHAANYLKANNRLALSENRNITPEEIVENFLFANTVSFLRHFYNST